MTIAPSNIVDRGRPLRVLFIVETLGIGGTEQSLLQILPRFQEVTPLLCQLYQGSTLKPAFEAAGVSVVSLNLPPKYHLPTAVRQVSKLCQQEGPQLIVTALFRADLVGRVVGHALGIPVVGSIVSECYARARLRGLSPTGRLKLKAVQLIDMVGARWVSHFSANSETIKNSESISLRIPRAKITVVPRGRSPHLYQDRLSEQDERRIRSSIPLLGDKRIVLNVGRLVESKGQLDLIRALKIALIQVPNLALLLVGDGDFRSTLQSEANRLRLEEQVLFLGERHDIPSLLAISEAFAFPSHYEGHPGALVEAMLASKPVVASDIPVHREMIDPGHSGLLAPPCRPQELGSALLQLLLDGPGSLQMGRQARLFAQENYDIARIARKFEQLLRGIGK